MTATIHPEPKKLEANSWVAEDAKPKFREEFQGAVGVSGINFVCGTSVSTARRQVYLHCVHYN